MALLTATSQIPLPTDPLAPTLSIQNSAWATNGATSHRPYQFKGSFTDALTKYYQVHGAKSLDFKKESSADVVNKWTETATHGMIPTIIDAPTLSELIWVLLNTTYLEGKWQKSFGQPVDDDFTLPSGQTVVAKMMSTSGKFSAFDSADVQVMELKIVQSKLSAFVVLPKDPAKFASLQSAPDGIWSSAFWSKIMPALKPLQAHLTMPKFSFEYGVTMHRDDPLTVAMGLNFLYQNSANFSNMDGAGSEPSKVGIIKQNTKIEWNENGIKAAAATLIGGVGRSAIPRNELDMVVDHPFYFAVYDRSANAFLFLGQVVDPR